jgi:hypothetical protein
MLGDFCRVGRHFSPSIPAQGIFEAKFVATADPLPRSRLTGSR